MTATEELCRLLDERGVEYTFDHGCREFFWDLGESGRARAGAIGLSGRVHLVLTSITPEQAVEATLGRGECRIVKETKTIRSTYRGEVEVTDEKCSECGGYMEVCTGVSRNYCPNCGRKVIA